MIWIILNILGALLILIIGGIFWGRTVLKRGIAREIDQEIVQQSLNANYFGTDADQFNLRKSGALILTDDQLIFIPLMGKSVLKIPRHTLVDAILIDHLEERQLRLPLLQVKTTEERHLWALPRPHLWKKLLS